MRQLPLGVQLRLTSRFATFNPAGNEAAVAALSDLRRGPAQPAIWLAGPVGVGKSHLLQSACAAAGEAGGAVAYLPLTDESSRNPGLLGGLETLDVVLIDDVDEVIGQRDWEQGLFRLYNELQERGGRLLLASQATPAASPIQLPDLASRLRASLVHVVAALPEAGHAAALLRRAEMLGLELPPDTLAWLLRRAPRDYSALCRLLDRLDLAALAAQRRLTVPFVRSVLGEAD